MEGEEVPTSVKSDIKEFLRLDDGMKQARLDMKESRGVMNEHRENIIKYMRHSKSDKLAARKGEVTLLLQQKQQKIRPDTTVVKEKIKELMDNGVTDPTKIWEEIDKCGGTRDVWKLARRSKRTAKKE